MPHLSGAGWRGPWAERQPGLELCEALGQTRRSMRGVGGPCSGALADLPVLPSSPMPTAAMWSAHTGKVSPGTAGLGGCGSWCLGLPAMGIPCLPASAALPWQRSQGWGWGCSVHRSSEPQGAKGSVVAAAGNVSMPRPCRHSLERVHEPLAPAATAALHLQHPSSLQRGPVPTACRALRPGGPHLHCHARECCALCKGGGPALPVRARASSARGGCGTRTGAACPMRPLPTGRGLAPRGAGPAPASADPGQLRAGKGPIPLPPHFAMGTPHPGTWPCCANSSALCAPRCGAQMCGLPENSSCAQMVSAGKGGAWGWHCGLLSSASHLSLSQALRALGTGAGAGTGAAGCCAAVELSSPLQAAPR